MDGANRTAVSRSEGDMLHPPSWSPDGERLVFAHSPHDDAGWIESVRVDGSGSRRVVPCRWEPKPSDPDWSPDGKRIVFHDGLGIAVADADGSDHHRVTDNPDDYDPTWSGDGERIVFSAFGHGLE